MGVTMTIGDRIRAVRKKRGLTQTQLAERMSVSPTHISRWEYGGMIPSLFHAINLADELDVSLDFLVGRVRQK